MSEYKINLVPSIRQFEKQTQTSKIGENWMFQVDSLEDFFSEMFLHCEPFLKREIIIDPLEKTHAFGEKETPDPSDLPKFVKIRDPISKYTYEMESINEARLQIWSDERQLLVFIYPHSHSITYRSEWNAIHKGTNALIKSVPADKSGAPAEEAIEEMVTKLKECHRFNYTGMHIHWRTWAQYILNQRSTDHDVLIPRPPPRGILELFETALSNARSRIALIREDVNIAEGINGGLGLEIQGLIRDFDNIVRLSTEKLEAEQSFQRKLTALAQKVNNNKDNLYLFAAAHRPQETTLSENYLNNVGTQDDVDHTEEDVLLDQDTLEDNAYIEEYLDMDTLEDNA